MMHAGVLASLPQTSPAAQAKFVRHRVDRRVQRVAMRIAPSAIVDQGPHSRNANRHFGQPFAPGTTETVADNDRNLNPQLPL